MVVADPAYVVNRTPSVQGGRGFCAEARHMVPGASILQSITSFSRTVEPGEIAGFAAEAAVRTSEMDNASIEHCNFEASIRPFLEQELRGKVFTYVVNPGNAGDALIQHGTLLLFDDIGLTFEISNHTSIHRNRTLVYSGAGNLVGNLYHDCARFLASNAPLAMGNRIVLLPATIRNEDALLRSLQANVKIFARDRPSYDYVKEMSPKASVCLSKDMAFYIEGLDRSMPSLRKHAHNPSKPGIVMLRTDLEGFGAALIPRGNRDLSAEGYVKFDGSEMQYRQHIRDVSHRVLGITGEYAEVWTNRLHLCIASSIVGVEAHCMDNNYGKVKAVFEFSLLDIYPNSHWDGLVSNRPWHNSSNVYVDPCEFEASIRPFLEQELQGKHFTYVVNPGNAGDALIQHATLLLFDDLGLTYEMSNHTSIHRNRTLVYSGGGNLVGELYGDCAQFLAANAPLAMGNHIVLLPATIQNEDALLRSLDTNVRIFTRERMSYTYVKAVAPDATVCVSKDMSFYVEELDRSMPSLRNHAHYPAKRGIVMLRTDLEGFGIASIPKDNRDLSAEGHVEFNGSQIQYRQHVRDLSHRILGIIGEYTEVWTNRLNLCIASSLVGVVAHCMDNNYGKVKAVFEFSLLDVYPNSHWDGHVSSRPWQNSSNLNGLAPISSVDRDQEAGFLSERAGPVGKFDNTSVK